MVDIKVDKTAHKRPNFPTDFKRRLVEESLEPGASASLIARRNDINANLLFKWRQQYIRGAYGLATLEPDRKIPPLLPVNIVAETPDEVPTTVSNAGEPLENVCEIEFDHARLRIRGDVSPTMLRLLIRELSQ
jgi:transposase